MLEPNNYEKYVILGDTHFGKGKGSPEFLENQIAFFKEQLVPFMKTNGICEIIQLGDFLDHRKTLDGIVYYKVKELLEFLKENDIYITTLLGNHDLYHRESLDLHLMDIFKNLFPDSLTVCKDQERLSSTNNKTVAIIPWLTEGMVVNEELKNYDYILGHFEMKHFEVVKGVEAKHGLDVDYFNPNSKIFSGHYHNLQRKGNILYTGTPYQFDWSDFKEPKGFWVTDFNDIEVFFENKVSLKHIKVIYDDSDDFAPITIQGHEEKDYSMTVDEFLNSDKTFIKHKLKFLINFSKTGNHIKCIQLLKEFPQVDIINNYQVSQIIKADYAETFKHQDVIIDESTKKEGTLEVIAKACEENNISHVLDSVIKAKAEM